MMEVAPIHKVWLVQYYHLPRKQSMSYKRIISSDWSATTIADEQATAKAATNNVRQSKSCGKDKQLNLVNRFTKFQTKQWKENRQW